MVSTLSRRICGLTRDRDFLYVAAGGCCNFPKAIMWITCSFTWMLRIPHSFPMVGVHLQLDVKGCKDVYESFDKYVEVERLEGENKYHAEQFGLQDTKKEILFIDFPPILQLQLKQFEYDFKRDTMMKINDCYEFPLQIDLDKENGKYLSPDADMSVQNLKTLHSILVHKGGVHGGHYYAFIRLMLSDQWFKFDDERVTKEELKRALKEQYGGEEDLPQTNPGFNNTPFKFTTYSNAYMLLHIRD